MIGAPLERVSYQSCQKIYIKIRKSNISSIYYSVGGQDKIYPKNKNKGRIGSQQSQPRAKLNI